MVIVPNQAFLDGGDRYEAGLTYDVPDDRGTYFLAQGWASSPDGGGDPDGPEVPIGLYVHDSSAGQSEEVL